MKPLKLFLYSYALAMNVVVGALFLIATRRFAGESSNALYGALAGKRAWISRIGPLP